MQISVLGLRGFVCLAPQWDERECGHMACHIPGTILCFIYINAFNLHNCPNKYIGSSIAPLLQM